MERLWSLAGATSGNRWQIGRPRKRRNQAEPVATGCVQLPWDLDGKEGVGFESVRGLCKSPACRGFCVQVDLLVVDRAMGMEPFMELPSRELASSPMPFADVMSCSGRWVCR